MDNRSSISSSEPELERKLAAWVGFPRAGLLALLLVLAFDRTLVGNAFPWADLVAHVRPVQSVYWGVTRDRAELQRVARADADAPGVVILGSSRGQTGFIREVAADTMPGVEFAKLSHALQDPVTLHALTPELINAGTRIAVFTISHVDTHRPVRLEPLPAKSTARIATLVALVRTGGTSILAEHRTSLYRIAAARVSNLYRFRDSLGRAGGNVAREFPLERRLEGRRGMQLQGPAVIGAAGPTRLPADVERRLLSRVLPHQRRWVYQLAWFAEVRGGPHADLQMALLTDTIVSLREAGIEVVIAECPVHPIGNPLVEPGSEQAFRSFANQLAHRDGVWFLPLDAQPAYHQQDFMDLFHLNEMGGSKLTRSIVNILPGMLGETAQPPSMRE